MGLGPDVDVYDDTSQREGGWGKGEGEEASAPSHIGITTKAEYLPCYMHVSSVTWFLQPRQVAKWLSAEMPQAFCTAAITAHTLV